MSNRPTTELELNEDTTATAPGAAQPAPAKKNASVIRSIYSMIPKQLSEEEKRAKHKLAYERTIKLYDNEMYDTEDFAVTNNVVTKAAMHSANFGMYSANYLIAFYNSNAFKSYLFKVAMVVVALAAAAVLFALLSNVGVPAAITAIVAGLTPFFFKLTFGAAIAVGAVAVTALATSFHSTGGHFFAPKEKPAAEPQAMQAGVGAGAGSLALGSGAEA